MASRRMMQQRVPIKTFCSHPITCDCGWPGTDGDVVVGGEPACNSDGGIACPNCGKTLAGTVPAQQRRKETDNDCA